MGKMLSGIADARDDVSIVAGLDRNTQRMSSFPVYADPMEFPGGADVMVDFSAITALSDLLTYCRKKKLPVVLCTTGYSDEQVEEIKKASKEIPILRSGNMSLGVNLLLELIKTATKTLGPDFDIEIIEKHHNQKVDAPSGTALMMAEAAKQAREDDARIVCGRSGSSCKRQSDEIGISSLRGGAIVGEHSIIFAGSNEIIELKHTAMSRELFATGALRAAAFLAGKTPGLYSMADVVG